MAKKSAPLAQDGNALFDAVMNATSPESLTEDGAIGEEGDSTEPPVEEPPPQEPQQRHTVPLAELLDERDRRQALERRLNDLEAERKKAEPQPDYLTQPDQFTDRRIAAALDPFRQAFAIQIAHAHKATATLTHGADLVEKAQSAFDAEVQEGRLHPSEHQRVMGSVNPFTAAVEWFQNRQMLAEVGNDPAAYKNRLLDEALSDPEFLGRAIEAARAHAAGRPVAVAPRQAPKASAPARNGGRAPLPPSLNRQGPPGGQPDLASSSVDPADLYDEMVNPNKLTE